MRWFMLFLGLGWSSAVWAARPLQRLEVMVDAVVREALVHRPERIGPEGAPLVFVFHGHGGTMRHAARSMPLHEHWPDAIVVYPQGLPTPGRLTDPEGKRSGWQTQAGAQDDRDLKFFDALRRELEQAHRVNEARVHATGHSNGGAFTYLLWAERGEVLASVAPSAAVLGRESKKLTPKPVLHVGSPKDELVKFAWQERMLARVLSLNGCPPLQPELGYREYPSKLGQSVAVLLHDGGHRFPTEHAPAQIAKFFQANPRR
jgi:polyhydroxybutyrate depolymerase